MGHVGLQVASFKSRSHMVGSRREFKLRLCLISISNLLEISQYTCLGSQAVRRPDSRRTAASRVQEHNFVGREPASFLDERCASAGLPCWRLREHRRVPEEDCYWQDTDRLSARGHIVGLVLLEVPGTRIRNTLGLVSEEHRLLWKSYPNEVRHELAGSLVCDARSHSHLHT